jgi:hypothetical protein
MDVLVWWRRGFTPSFVPFECDVSFFDDVSQPREAVTLRFGVLGGIMWSGDSPAFLGETLEAVVGGTSALLDGRMLRDVGVSISPASLLPAVLDALPKPFVDQMSFAVVDQLGDGLTQQLVRAGLLPPSTPTRAENALAARNRRVDASLLALPDPLPGLIDGVA